MYLGNRRENQNYRSWQGKGEDIEQVKIVPSVPSVSDLGKGVLKIPTHRHTHMHTDTHNHFSSVSRGQEKILTNHIMVQLLF